jgi:hypothetical protein
MATLHSTIIMALFFFQYCPIVLFWLRPVLPHLYARLVSSILLPRLFLCERQILASLFSILEPNS